METGQACDYSGWRGGIGIAFGSPSRRIPDVMELGYEIAWGVEDFPGEVSDLGVAIFRYWNSIVEVTLRDRDGAYDFSGMEDKAKAAVLAFDAWAEKQLGSKGLSRYAVVEHRPEGSYGDVMGSMDYSSPNPLVNGLVESYLRWFEENGVRSGGIALDNAGKVPESFVRTLRERFTARGLGIATNGCPDELLPLVDFFGNEGFPFTVPRAREVRARGFRGILGEFTMQHLSAGELAAYLAAKLFNRIVFFGYTNGGTAAGAAHSFYGRRPDVYDHQRWVLRKYVSLSRAVLRAGEQAEPGARLARSRAAGSGDGSGPAPRTPGSRSDGAVFEWNRKYDVRKLMARSLGDPFVKRFGSPPGPTYLYVGSTEEEELLCESAGLGLGHDAVAWDELGERLLPARREGDLIRLQLDAGPCLVQLGDRRAVAASMIERVEELFAVELRQRELDRHGRQAHALESWRGFCDGYAVDTTVSRSGRASLRLSGGERATYNGRYRYHGRQGAAQLVNLEGARVEALTLELWSRSEGVPASAEVPLRSREDRDRHFSAREGSTFAAHLYLDFQDGSWPEVTTLVFPPGTRDWERRRVTVRPSLPAKTAMVLLELHQPAGTAWFDDLQLSLEGRPGENLLLFPGFEPEPELLERSERAGSEYEAAVAGILRTLGRARREAGTESIRAATAAVDEARRWLDASGLARLWGYEWRDLEDASRRLARCTEVVLG